MLPVQRKVSRPTYGALSKNSDFGSPLVFFVGTDRLLSHMRKAHKSEVKGLKLREIVQSFGKYVLSLDEIHKLQIWQLQPTMRWAGGTRPPKSSKPPMRQPVVNDVDDDTLISTVSGTKSHINETAVLHDSLANDGEFAQDATATAAEDSSRLTALPARPSKRHHSESSLPSPVRSQTSHCNGD